MVEPEEEMRNITEIIKSKMKILTYDRNKGKIKKAGLTLSFVCPNNETVRDEIQLLTYKNNIQVI